MSPTAHDDGATIAPILSRALPSMLSHSLPPDYVPGQPYTRILARRYYGYDDDDGGGGGSAGCVITETELFLKRVIASSHARKSWTDMRRKLIYLRTEVRFYGEIVPMLLDPSSTHGDDGKDGASSSSKLRNHLPTVHLAEYDLDGLIPEDCPTTFAKQPSPLPPVGGDDEDDDDDDGGRKLREQLLEGKGGHILLRSIPSSSSVSSETPDSSCGACYHQDSPITLQQSSACLAALAELHASAWGDAPMLRRIGDRLSSAGGSYSLQFRNPNELSNMVASWECFREQFVSAGGAGMASGSNGSGGCSTDGTAATCILKKESVMRLGRRIFDMAEYVSRELTPGVDDEYATLVHGDFKAMNVFLPNQNQEQEGDEGKGAIMIDFSCTGIGYGMSDVGMHIAHAVHPRDLENGGEEWLVEKYMSALEEAKNRRGKLGVTNGRGRESREYPRMAAMRHYRLACVDYLRFVMGRFWRSASPESFREKRDNKNVTLINRNLEAAVAFIERVDGYLADFEMEKRAREGN